MGRSVSTQRITVVLRKKYNKRITNQRNISVMTDSVGLLNELTSSQVENIKAKLNNDKINIQDSNGKGVIKN